MSYELVSIAAGVDPSDIPPEGFRTPDDFYDLFGDELLTASSRNGYLAFFIQRVVSEYGFTSLSFLYSKPWNAPGNFVGTLLTLDAMAAVMMEIDELFDRIKADPDTFLALDGSISCCAKHLLEAVDQAEFSLHPMIDGGDDRQHAQFIAFVPGILQTPSCAGSTRLVRSNVLNEAPQKGTEAINSQIEKGEGGN